MTSRQLSAWEATHQTIARRYHSNKDVRLVICPTSSYYQFHSSSNNFTAFPFTFNATYHIGKCNARPVSFVPLPNANEEYASTIYQNTSRFSDRYVQRAWPPVFVQQKDFSKSDLIPPFLKQGFWAIPYDSFETHLNNWFEQVQVDQNYDARRRNFNDGTGLLVPLWRTNISNLLRVICVLFLANYVHGGLEEMANYVVGGDQLRLINVQRKLLSVSYSEFKNELMHFRNMLRKLMSTWNTYWPERDAFLNYFDRCNDNIPTPVYIEILLGYPILRTARERMNFICYVKAEHNNWWAFGKWKNEYSTYVGWNKNWKTWPGYLQLIYNYSGYTRTPESLLRFLRNVSQHYDEHGVSVEKVDQDIRTYFPGFVERLHERCYRDEKTIASLVS